MRLFTALDISAETRAALTALLGALRPAADFKWSPPENLHITTKFIGNVTDGQYPALVDALNSVSAGGPREISISGLGWFPNPHNPRVLFAGVDADLQALHSTTDAACAAIGIPAETKPFRPHLTLARVKSPDGLAEVRKRIAQWPSLEFGRFTAAAFHLYESVPTPRGVIYTQRQEFPLR